MLILHALLNSLPVLAQRPVPLSEDSWAPIGLGLRGEREHVSQQRAAMTLESEFVKRSQDTSCRYKTDSTQQYLVTSMPEVDWDFGEMYSGLIPIAENKSEGLFFVFKPKVGDPVDEVMIWLNGGPGCSSFEGFFQENGPITWRAGTFKPRPNPYTWANLTNMLWVDQPIGTGFSIGTPIAGNQDDIAKPFAQWFKKWQQEFGIKNHKIFITGESYAGKYIPYIAGAMLDQNDTEHFDLKGSALYNPSLGSAYIGEATTYPFVKKFQYLFGFNDTYMAEIEEQHNTCGYKEFIDTNMAFPPPGPQRSLFVNYSDPNDPCISTVWNEVYNMNPCFNPYSINEQCPMLYDPLGFPGGFVYTPPGAVVYPNRTDVKEALHAPMEVNWQLCGVSDVFPNGDNSLKSTAYALPRLIEATDRVLIGSGDFDMVLQTNHTLLAIQNMTWHGQQGFQTAPNQSFIVDLPEQEWTAVYEANKYPVGGKQGTMGIKHFERGLMWVEGFMAGHMGPMYQPRAAYRHLEWVLGRIDEL